MMDTDNIERLWEICDDLGRQLTEDDIVEMWRLYCEHNNIDCCDDLPVSPKKLFKCVKEGLKLFDEVTTS